MMKSIYDVVDRSSGELRRPAPPRLPLALSQLGCGQHEFAREGHVIYCTRLGCSTRLYPGGLHYVAVAAAVGGA